MLSILVTISLLKKKNKKFLNKTEIDLNSAHNFSGIKINLILEILSIWDKIRFTAISKFMGYGSAIRGDTVKALFISLLLSSW